MLQNIPFNVIVFIRNLSYLWQHIGFMFYGYKCFEQNLDIQFDWGLA